MYRSEAVRAQAPEMDPLRLGMGWRLEDLEKPQILVESTFGDSHPGSAHLLELVELARRGVVAYGKLFSKKTGLVSREQQRMTPLRTGGMNASR